MTVRHIPPGTPGLPPPSGKSALALVVITTKEKEDPEKFVVREHLFSGKTHSPSKLAPLAIASTIDDARKVVPRGLERMLRLKNDGEGVVEAWGTPLVLRYLQHVGRTL